MIATLRRTLGLTCAAYFDDNLVVDFEHTAPRAKQLLQEVFSVIGTPPKASKSYPMQGHRAFLGAIIDLMEVHPEGSGMARVSPKDSSRRQVALDISKALSQNHITMAQAAKTRGRSTWVGTNSFGKLGRLGLAVLKHLQYHWQRELTPEQRRSLQFHQDMVMQIPPKQVSVTTQPQTPLVIYSDAEYTPGSERLPRLGWVLFRGAGHAPIGQTMVLPRKVWLTWQHRQQQFSPQRR